MSRLTWDGTAEPVSRDQILRHERGEGNIHFFLSSADHEQDWQSDPIDPYSCHIYVCFNVSSSCDTGEPGMGSSSIFG